MFDSLKKKLSALKSKESERIEELEGSEESDYSIPEEPAEEPKKKAPAKTVKSTSDDDGIDDDFWDDEAFWKNDKFFEDVPEDEEDFQEDIIPEKPALKPAPKSSPKPPVKKEPVKGEEKPAVETSAPEEPKKVSIFERRSKQTEAVPKQKEEAAPPKSEEIKPPELVKQEEVKVQPVKYEEVKPPEPVKQEEIKVQPAVKYEEVKTQPVAEPETKSAEESKKGFFSKRSEKKHEAPAVAVKSSKSIDKDDIESILWDLEIGLLESDVALPVIDTIKEGVQQVLSERKIERGENLGDIVEEALKSAIGGVLQSNEFDFDKFIDECDKPAVVMFVGINGTGKTTSIAKLTNRLQKNGRTVVLAASDTFRAGAIEQLTIHSDNLGVKIIKHQSGADPAAVAYDAVEHAKSKHKDVVLVDTAGRMQTNSNLMDEMKKIKRVVKPNLVVFVGDALAGNDAVEQAKAFNDAIGLDAIILTKIDADAKGGAALSIAHSIGKPIAFMSTGQEYEDIIKFDSGWMLDRLFSD